MKILLAYSHPKEILEFNKHIENEEASLNFTYKHIEITFVQTGYTVYETAFALGQALAEQSYHLVLFAGLANSLNSKMHTGDVLNVINDLPFAIGRKDDNGFEHAYTLGWLDKTQEPHQRGGYINLSNSYFNVFLPYMKAAAITCPTLEGDSDLLQLKTERFQFHIETSNGLGFHYACLSKKLPFYQLRAVEYNAINRDRNTKLALENLNNALIQIIDLL